MRRRASGGLLLAVWGVLLSPSWVAQAQHLPDTTPYEHESAIALSPEQHMQTAEQRYRNALIRIRNGNPDGLEDSNRALEDMEDSVLECARAQTACAFWHVLATYKRLLKLQADEAEAGLAETINEVPDSLPVAGSSVRDDDGLLLDSTSVPPDASALALLRADHRQFLDQVQMNPAVQAGIRRWLTDLRVSLVTSYENYQYMRHLMLPAFRRHDLPEALLFGILAKESNGRVHSRSRAGAAGPLQFMPNTGRRFGLGMDASGFDTRYDPQAAADAAAQYLLERLAEVGHHIEYWLAAYNGGEGRARRVHAQTGGRSFWDSEVSQQFPDETRDYVPMVIAAAWLYLHSDDYGLTFPQVDARPASITLVRPASIYELTICLGNGETRAGYLRVLRNLNPSYAAETWIPAGTQLKATERMAGLYRRWCTQGTRADLARQLIEADPQTTQANADNRRSNRGSVHSYRVRNGDTLGAIARRHGCDLKSLAAANGIRAPRYFLRTGQRVRLEGCVQ